MVRSNVLHKAKQAKTQQENKEQKEEIRCWNIEVVIDCQGCC